MSDLVAPTTVADLLAFEAWPVEMQQIARHALGRRVDDLGYAIDSDAAREEAEENADHQWFIARKHIAGVIKKLREAHETIGKVAIIERPMEELIDSADASVTTAINMLDALPEDFADLEDDA